MASRIQTKSIRQTFDIICGWSPKFGVYVADVSGQKLPDVVRQWAVGSVRTGRLQVGTVRTFVVDDGIIRSIADRDVCEFEFESKTRAQIPVYLVYGPLRGNL